MDRQLDDARTGSFYLRQPEIAKIVVDGLHYGVVMGRYDLGAFVVMANHVHALLLPRVDPSVIMKSLKGFTARRANRLLGCTGQPFWQAESYDHWVRDEVEYGRIEQYIENNPVKAGLVQRAEEFPWSSAGERVGREIR